MYFVHYARPTKPESFMDTTTIGSQAVSFGTQADRLKFLRYLRDEARFTNEDIAKASGYGSDTVKGWFSDNPDRQRKVKDRALQLLLANLKIQFSAYQAVVNRDN